MTIAIWITVITTAGRVCQRQALPIKHLGIETAAGWAHTLKRKNKCLEYTRPSLKFLPCLNHDRSRYIRLN